MMQQPASGVAVPTPQQAQAQAQYTAQQNPGSEEIQSLWIGDLLPWMEESYLLTCFSHTGEVISAKVICNKQTGISDGYGFIEFVSRGAADRVLQTYNGTGDADNDDLEWDDADLMGRRKVTFPHKRWMRERRRRRVKNEDDHVADNDDSESDDVDYNLLESYDDDDDQPKE
ncbi:polyadenylate-binding protein RBP45C [Fagus crenata]